MSSNPGNIRFLEKGEQIEGPAATGVSLHCHTLHSRELLDFIPYYIERIPIASSVWRRAMQRRVKRVGQLPDFTNGYWEPPLTGKDVFEQETSSLREIGLGTIVSITDHDSISANLEIRAEVDPAVAPISMEWTVPFEEAFFHVGIHNMPADRAEDFTSQLLAYTKADGYPDNSRLHEIFSMLNECPETLVVLNHPVWDIEMIGQQRHERALTRFVSDHSKWIHAIEVNGFRAWSENDAAIRLAEDLGLPIISGGDRHCLHSNTMVNVTCAETFTDFVSEIRNDRQSSIIVRPEYHIPLPSRQLASITQIMGYFGDFAEGRRRWTDRVHIDFDGSGIKTLTEYWNGRQPLWTWTVIAALGILASPAMQPLISAFVGDKDIGRSDEQGNAALVISPFPAAATERGS